MLIADEKTNIHVHDDDVIDFREYTYMIYVDIKLLQVQSTFENCGSFTFTLSSLNQRPFWGQLYSIYICTVNMRTKFQLVLNYELLAYTRG